MINLMMELGKHSLVMRSVQKYIILNNIYLLPHSRQGTNQDRKVRGLMEIGEMKVISNHDFVL